MMKWMDETDFKDQKLQPYLMGRKTGKQWYLKFFTRILIVNSYFISNLLHPQQKVHYVVYTTDLVPASSSIAGKPAINPQP